MKDLYDFGCEFAQTYIGRCECGEDIEMSTQRDECPEYYTSVYVKCKCGKSVRFQLPVN